MTTPAPNLVTIELPQQGIDPEAVKAMVLAELAEIRVAEQVDRLRVELEDLQAAAADLTNAMEGGTQW